MANIAMVVLAHDNRESLSEFVVNVRRFCPNVSLFLYNSGADNALGNGLDIEMIPSPRHLEYAKITLFFLDVFEWLLNQSHRFEVFINAETDMLFVRRGYERFVSAEMRRCDYMAPLFSRRTSPKSRWRPYRSLRPELPDWFKIWGFEYTNRAFSPAQVFSRTYISRLLNHDKYSRIRQLARENQSFTLQEVLFPTLVDFLKLTGKCYPDGMEPIIRYRPFQAVTGVRRAVAMPNAYLVHPVRRNPDDPARRFIASL